MFTCSLIRKWLLRCILALTVCNGYIAMARMSMETRRRVIVLFKRGFKLKKIKARLEEESIRVSKTSLCLLIKKYKTTGMIADKVRPPAKTKKLELEDLCLIDESLDNDDEISTNELRSKLREAGVVASLSTIQRAKKYLG